MENRSVPKINLEDLKAAQKGFRVEFSVGTTCNLRLTTYGKCEVAKDRLEECLQTVVGRTNPGAIERGGW